MRTVSFTLNGKPAKVTADETRLRLRVLRDDLNLRAAPNPSVVPIGAVVASAVFDATGARFRRLPVTPARVLAAITADA